MTNWYRSGASVLLMSGLLLVLPVQVTGDSAGVGEAFANNAGGNGKGKGQGATRAGSTGGGAVASAGGKAKGHNNSLKGNELGRFNAVLSASSSAWEHASANSPIGMIAQTYANALVGYLGATGDLAAQATALDSAAAILAAVANKDEISPELIEAVNARIAAENPDNPTLAALGNPTADPAVATTNSSLAAELSTLATALQQADSSEGLGPIY